MPDELRQMWKELGLDLKAHAALLDAVVATHAATIAARPDRPAAMRYFDDFVRDLHGRRVRELLDARAEGRTVVATLCALVPEEILLAFGCIMVGMCGGVEVATAEAERLVPRTTCALVKGAFGASLARVCPWLAASSVVVGENSCEGKKKGWEIFEELQSRLYVIDLPQTKSGTSYALMLAEYGKLAVYLEELTHRKLDAESLREAVATVNAKRAALQRLGRLRAASPAPISGLDALLAAQVAVYDDPERYTAAINALCDEIEGRAARGEGVAPDWAPRIIVSGCPMALGNWKLPAIIERAGAVIVGEESCVGERGVRHLTADGGDSVEGIIDAVADRYFRIDCAIFSSNLARLHSVVRMKRELGAHGVVHYALHHCTPYQTEAMAMKRHLEKQGIPALIVDSDYGRKDTAQVRAKVEAFVKSLCM